MENITANNEKNEAVLQLIKIKMNNMITVFAQGRMTKNDIRKLNDQLIAILEEHKEDLQDYSCRVGTYWSEAPWYRKILLLLTGRCRKYRRALKIDVRITT